MRKTTPDLKECGLCPKCGAKKARCIDWSGVTGLECEECLFSASVVDWHQPPVHTPPATVAGVPVYQSGEALEYLGNRWVTLAPEDAEDDRIWEFSLTSGRLVRTR